MTYNPNLLVQIVAQDLDYVQEIFNHLPADFACVRVSNLGAVYVVTIMKSSMTGGRNSRRGTRGLASMQICNDAAKDRNKLVTK